MSHWTQQTRTFQNLFLYGFFLRANNGLCAGDRKTTCWMARQTTEICILKLCKLFFGLSRRFLTTNKLSLHHATYILQRAYYLWKERFLITSTEQKLFLCSYLTYGTTIRRKITQPKAWVVLLQWIFNYFILI